VANHVGLALEGDDDPGDSSRASFEGRARTGRNFGFFHAISAQNHTLATFFRQPHALPVLPVPCFGVRDLQMEVKPPCVPPSSLQTHHSDGSSGEP